MLMEDCPRWDKCSAPICPLDPDWSKRVHRKGERICLWLTESVKENAKAVFEGAGLAHILQEIQSIAPAIIASRHTIRTALERASNTGSKMTALSRNRKCPN